MDKIKLEIKTEFPDEFKTGGLELKKMNPDIMDQFGTLEVFPDSMLTLKDIANTPSSSIKDVELARNKDFVQEFFVDMSYPDVVDFIANQKPVPADFVPDPDAVTVSSPIFLQMREVYYQILRAISRNESDVNPQVMMLFHNVHQIIGSSFDILARRLEKAIESMKETSEEKTPAESPEIKFDDTSYEAYLELLAQENKDLFLNWLPSALKEGAPTKSMEHPNMNDMFRKTNVQDFLDYMLYTELQKQKTFQSTQDKKTDHKLAEEVGGGLAAGVGAASGSAAFTWLLSKSSVNGLSANTGSTVLDSVINQYVSDQEAMEAANKEIGANDNPVEDQLPDTPDHEPGEGNHQSAKKSQAVRCRRSVGCANGQSMSAGPNISGGIQAGIGALGQGLSTMCGMLFMGGSGLLGLAGSFFLII